jgi:hypothetical protein
VLVHLRHLQLVFEVGASAQTLDDRGQTAGLHEVDDQPFAGFNAQVRQMRRRLLDHRDALGGAEHALLVGVDQHRDDDLVELGGRALQDVDVAEGDRVERSGAYGATHDR